MRNDILAKYVKYEVETNGVLEQKSIVIDYCLIVKILQSSIKQILINLARNGLLERIQKVNIN